MHKTRHQGHKFYTTADQPRKQSPRARTSHPAQRICFLKYLGKVRISNVFTWTSNRRWTAEDQKPHLGSWDQHVPREKKGKVTWGTHRGVRAKTSLFSPSCFALTRSTWVVKWMWICLLSCYSSRKYRCFNGHFILLCFPSATLPQHHQFQRAKAIVIHPHVIRLCTGWSPCHHNLRIDAQRPKLKLPYCQPVISNWTSSSQNLGIYCVNNMTKSFSYVFLWFSDGFSCVFSLRWASGHLLLRQDAPGLRIQGIPRQGVQNGLVLKVGSGANWKFSFFCFLRRTMMNDNHPGIFCIFLYDWCCL